MSAQANVTLNTKVYSPRGKRGDIATWALVGDTTFGGASSLITESVRATPKSAETKVHFKLDVPMAAVADSACGCIGTITSRAMADVLVNVPDNLTLAERTDFSLRVQALVAHAIFTAAVRDREGAW